MLIEQHGSLKRTAQQISGSGSVLDTIDHPEEIKLQAKKQKLGSKASTIATKSVQTVPVPAKRRNTHSDTTTHSPPPAHVPSFSETPHTSRPNVDPWVLLEQVQRTMSELVHTNQRLVDSNKSLTIEVRSIRHDNKLLEQRVGNMESLMRHSVYRPVSQPTTPTTPRLLHTTQRQTTPQSTPSPVTKIKKPRHPYNTTPDEGIVEQLKRMAGDRVIKKMQDVMRMGLKDYGGIHEEDYATLVLTPDTKDGKVMEGKTILDRSLADSIIEVCVDMFACTRREGRKKLKDMMSNTARIMSKRGESATSLLSDTEFSELQD